MKDPPHALLSFPTSLHSTFNVQKFCCSFLCLPVQSTAPSLEYLKYQCHRPGLMAPVSLPALPHAQCLAHSVLSDPFPTAWPQPPPGFSSLDSRPGTPHSPPLVLVQRMVTAPLFYACGPGSLTVTLPLRGRDRGSEEGSCSPRSHSGKPHFRTDTNRQNSPSF